MWRKKGEKAEEDVDAARAVLDLKKQMRNVVYKTRLSWVIRRKREKQKV